jgi:hypothetical protein
VPTTATPEKAAQAPRHPSIPPFAGCGAAASSSNTAAASLILLHILPRVVRQVLACVKRRVENGGKWKHLPLLPIDAHSLAASVMSMFAVVNVNLQSLHYRTAFQYFINSFDSNAARLGSNAPMFLKKAWRLVNRNLDCIICQRTRVAM